MNAHLVRYLSPRLEFPTNFTHNTHLHPSGNTASGAGTGRSPRSGGEFSYVRLTLAMGRVTRVPRVAEFETVAPVIIALTPVSAAVGTSVRDVHVYIVNQIDGLVNASFTGICCHNARFDLPFCVGSIYYFPAQNNPCPKTVSSERERKRQFGPLKFRGSRTSI